MLVQQTNLNPVSFGTTLVFTPNLKGPDQEKGE